MHFITRRRRANTDASLQSYTMSKNQRSHMVDELDNSSPASLVRTRLYRIPLQGRACSLDLKRPRSVAGVADNKNFLEWRGNCLSRQRYSNFGPSAGLQSYKSGYSHEQAYKIIVEGDERIDPAAHFDPKPIELFKRCHKDMGRIWDELQVEA